MQRTPKNYDGITPPAKTIQELLPGVLGHIRAPTKTCNILEAWPGVIGPKMASMTKAISFERGILTVAVRSSTLYSLLCQHEKPRLLCLLQEQFPETQVRDIAFRIG